MSNRTSVGYAKLDFAVSLTFCLGFGHQISKVEGLQLETRKLREP
jgi:hypothetical protein